MNQASLHPCPPANQLAFPFMSEAGAAKSQRATDPSLAAVDTGPGLRAILAVFLAAGALVFALLFRSSSDTLLLTILSTLAMLGAFFLFGVAAGNVRLDARATEHDLVQALPDAIPTAIAVAARDGRIFYSNSAARRMAGGAPDLELSSLYSLVSPDRFANAADALFRLTRAAEAGHPHREVVTTDVSGEARHLAVAVQPLDVAGRAPEIGPLMLWTIIDESEAHRRNARTLADLEATVSHYDAVPAGLLAADADGIVRQMNATLARWLGLSADAISRGNVRLQDMLSVDSMNLIRALAASTPQRLASLDLDLKRADGTLLYARVSCEQADGGDGVMQIAVTDRSSDSLNAKSPGEGASLARFFRSAPFGIATVGPDGRIVSANAAFARMVQGGAADLRKTPVTQLLSRAALPELRAQVDQSLNQVLSGRANVAPVEITVGEKAEFVRRVYMSPLASAPGAREAAAIYIVDATEQKALEAKLLQSQKMEIVGQLAGGIAHDFRNMLTAIIGYSDLLLERHPPRDPAHQDIMHIKSSASRAVSLVSKLMAFSRQETQLPEVIDLGELLTEFAPILKQTAKEKVELKLSAGRDLWYVKADKTQLEQVMLNLVANARDAMPEGGGISIRTRNIAERESQKLAYEGMPVGEYVLIEVTDTGSGMPPEVLAKIFEPFFTTKSVGKGTGLGLATVYGIVKQSGGFVYPESTVGTGTTFRVFLPRHHADDGVVAAQRATKAAAKKESERADLTGKGRVLLVEDEDLVRGFAVRALKSRGFEVLEAASGVEALEVLARITEPVDIVVSDVVMPEMDGPTLLKEVRKTNPTLKFIFTSGHPNDNFRDSIGETEFAFLPKPYSLPDLATKVKQELAR